MKKRHLLCLLSLPWLLVASCADDRIDDTTGVGGVGGEGGAGPSIGGPTFGLTFEEIPLEGDPVLVTHFEFLPSSQEFLATTQSGRVFHYELHGDTTRLLGEFEISEVFGEGDCGLLSLTLAPDFEETGRLFAGYCISLTHSSIVQYEFDPSEYDGIDGTRTQIITVGTDAARQPIHAVGKIGFDQQGNLWALFGEKGRGTQARSPTSLLGSVVRLRPRPSGGYDGPDPPNPTFPDSSGIPLTYAYGLRSPWSGTLDSRGRLWVGDVGHNNAESFEEINLVSEPGLDFGWNLRQGPCEEDCAGQRDPIVSWQRRPIGERENEDPDLVASTSRVGWVGVEYRETVRDRYEGLMHGKVLYGDMCLGFVRGIEIDDEENVVFDRHLGHLPGASAWKVGPDGYIYAMMYARCLSGVAVDEPPIGKLMRARLRRG